MNKFIISILLIVIILSCSSNHKKEYPEIWVWMHGNKDHTINDWEKVFYELGDFGIEGVLFGGDEKQLRTIIPIADKYDIDIHAWFWTMNRSDAKPEWLSVNRNNESLADKKAYVDYYKFMCPAIPEVKDFVIQHISELLKIKGLKGIHMDYVRYVDVILPEAIQPDYNIVQDREFPEYDFGYHPYMRKLYMTKYGIDPIAITDPENDEQWKQFRYDQLTQLINQIKKVTDSNNVILSAAVFPTPEIARKLVRQDWENWPLDFVFPMVYHNFYNKEIDWITEAVQEGTSSLNTQQKLFCGLYIPALQNKGDLLKAMNIAMDAGATGIALFDYRAIKGCHKEEIKSFINSLK